MKSEWMVQATKCCSDTSMMNGGVSTEDIANFFLPYDSNVKPATYAEWKAMCNIRSGITTGLSIDGQKNVVEIHRNILKFLQTIGHCYTPTINFSISNAAVLVGFHKN